MKESFDKHDAATAEDILSFLKANDIDLDMLSFQTYDFAASMSGRINGAQKVLQDILERRVPYIPCQGHRSNTFNEHCYNQGAIVTSMHDGLQDIYTYFPAAAPREIKFLRMPQKRSKNP